ncbi:MAG: adenosine deaminase [bacterium]|nr:adenosine deaminase [bacterium]MDE0290662.1 adenosine deaminase [bacterium]MDE0439115.1 adenosine deaminase [bacterium]
MAAPDTDLGTPPTAASLQRAPKVLLHDHLDGGLRPSTIVELAEATGYRDLPTHDPEALAAHLRAGARRRSLELYLEMFRHTFGVMQTDRALYRVAAECAEDLAADGVVYAEVRFAPELHRAGGLSLDQAIEAVTSGFRDGSEGRGIRVGTLVTAMRTGIRSLDAAEAAIRNRDRGVVGFDIAGAEAGYPPSQHLAAFQLLRRARFPFTIHAGEAYGLASIRDAVHGCGADRIGHGIRIVDDMGNDWSLGPLARHVRDTAIPLEQCPTSNVHIGAVGAISTHPVGRLLDLGFRVTVNTDNRLMSGTFLTRELDRCRAAFGWSWDEVRQLTVNAIEGAFLPADERREIVTGVIEPWYASRAG